MTVPQCDRAAVVGEREFIRTFRFSERVPRWRAHFYNAAGERVFDIRESELLPPLGAWTVCELSIEDAARLGGGVEIDDHG